jgi:peptidoglycan/LPS O-acetylase OafA/YrhL
MASSSQLSKPFSIYLDLVRLSAAVLVYFSHVNRPWLLDEWLPLGEYGPSSVVVFFVLSGFVIAYVTDTRERDWRVYVAARLSRLYSVALPALVLTVALDAVGRQLMPAAYPFPFDSFAVRIGASLVMLTEVWFVAITPFSNIPYWSISYELWYYVGFALVFYAPRRLGWWAVAVLALVLGPKVVLLAPIWALGVGLYRSRRLSSLSEGAGWVLVAATVAGIVGYHALGVEKVLDQWTSRHLGAGLYEQLNYSRHFLGHYLLGVLVMLHFAGVRAVAPRLEPLVRPLERPIKLLSATTPTLYLIHMPLLCFWSAVIAGTPRGLGYLAAVTVLVMLSMALVSWLIETRRHGLTRALQRLLARRGAAPVAQGALSKSA